MATKKTTLHFKEDTSDKVYEVWLEPTPSGKQAKVCFAYGRRGGNLKTGTKTLRAVALDKAKETLKSLVAEKKKKGYKASRGSKKKVTQTAIKKAGKNPVKKKGYKTKSSPKPKAAKALKRDHKIIEKTVRKTLDKPKGKLTKSDLKKVTSLDLDESQLTDITALKGLTQLEHLSLIDNQLEDLTPLKDLTRLTSLCLYHNELITGQQIVELMVALPKCRILFDAMVSSEDVIEHIRNKLNKPKGELVKSDLKKVTSLDLSYNQVTDITPLKSLTQLTSLCLFENSLTDITPLKGLTQLRDLGLGCNQVSDITPLKNLTQLTSLSLSETSLTDITPLKGLTQLRDLDLSDNELIDDIAPLKGLTQLRELVLFDCLLTVEEIEGLKRALLKCRIEH